MNGNGKYIGGELVIQPWRWGVIFALCILLPLWLFTYGVAASPESDYLWSSPTGATWGNISDGIYVNASNQTVFVNDVNFYVNDHIRYEYNISDWSVETPNRTWQTQQGSCIDDSILTTAMLTRHGVDAHIVYGIADGKYPHATVEIRDGDNQYFIDRRTITEYQKLGDGIAPRQYMLPDVML